MSGTLSSSPISIFLHLIMIIMASFAVTVRSDPDFLRLPSDIVNPSSSSSSSELCPVSVTPDSCPVKCFRTMPVCGVDNVTYWCGCAEARCAGTRVAKLGFCEFDNGGSGAVSGQALLLVHIVWLILLGFFVLFGLL